MNEIAISGVADADAIRARILTIRGVQVMLDRDLAELYGVPTKALNQAVKRNSDRFPEEFMFQLNDGEMHELVTNCDRFQSMKHTSVPMRAFSEHGIIMLASVLKSDAATLVSIRITRAFVAMRRAIVTLAPLLSRIEATERRQLRQEDAQARNEERFNAQYGDSLTVRVSDRFHDRFLIIDGATLIHVGASLNHLGRKCFAFSSLDKSNIPDILAKL